ALGGAGQDLTGGGQVLGISEADGESIADRGRAPVDLPEPLGQALQVGAGGEHLARRGAVSTLQHQFGAGGGAEQRAEGRSGGGVRRRHGWIIAASGAAVSNGAGWCRRR